MRYTDMFACAPECGCTFACSAPNRSLAREIASALDYRASGVGKLIVRATQAFRVAYGGADASE